MVSTGHGATQVPEAEVDGSFVLGDDPQAGEQPEERHEHDRREDTQAEVAELNADLRRYRYYPVLAIGIGVRF